MLAKNNGSAKKDTLHVLEVLGNAIVGGMEIYVRNLIRLLPSDLFRITCLCPYETEYTASLRQLGCHVFVTSMQEDPPWRSIQTAVEIIRNQQIDLVHAHLPKAHVLGGLAGCLTRTPVVATIHGMSMTTQELGISRTTGTNLLVVCQEAYIQALTMGVPPDRVTLIPNGVDLDTFVPDRSGHALREAIGVPLNVPLVGFVGRLAHEKGPDQFIRAAEYVHQQRPDVHFVLVGEGPMRQELTDMIQAMGLTDRVHLAGLWAEPWQVYPALDIVAQTSRVEGMPFSLLEGMACGRPVVAIAVGGVVELVEVGTTGQLVGPGDWQAVGDWLLELLADPVRLEAMGRAARERVEERFDLRTSIQMIGDLFYRLADARLKYPVPWPSTWPVVQNAR
ncbi:MAG: glycosyltransferase [Anaerolineales bacterium]|nr:glycosyltransferase [Anaerolineales bacterium]